MPRDRQRIRLESGPVIDLAKLTPRRTGRPGAVIRATLKAESGEAWIADLKLRDYGGLMSLTSSVQVQTLA